MRRSVSSILQEHSPQFHALGSDASVAEAVTLMNRHNIGAVLILDPEHQLLGIFTERDVLRRVLDRRLNYDTTRVEEVMTRQLFTLPASATIEEALVLVDQHNCRHLPVFDGDRLVGMVSMRDLTAALVADRESEIHDLTGYISGSY